MSEDTVGFAIVIEVMRCGTTSLFPYRGQHLHIFPSSLQEPEFCTGNLASGQCLAWYGSVTKSEIDQLRLRRDAAILQQALSDLGPAWSHRVRAR